MTTSRCYLIACGCLAVVLTQRVSMLTFAGERVTPKKLHIYVATYSAVEGEGIFRGEFDTSTGDILNLKPTGGITNPAAIVPHPSGKYFYATSSRDDDRGQSTGAVVAFAVDETTGEFTMIDRQSSGGTGPCFLSCHPQGKLIVIANCGTATVACLPLTNDGRFGNTSTVIQHDGQSRNSEGKPQAHSIQISPNGNFAVAADLGLDRLFVYRLNALNGTMAPHELKSVDLPQGNGPRHVTFHPSGRFIYVIGELGNTVSTLRTDVDTGETVLLQNITTLSQKFSGDSYAADIVIMPDGDFLYGTNRGEDSVAIWRVNGASGLLTTAGNTSCGGKFPRSAAIDPSGRFLIIGNQKSDQLQVFRIESKDGSIMPHGAPIPVPTPVCIKF